MCLSELGVELVALAFGVRGTLTRSRGDDDKEGFFDGEVTSDLGGDSIDKKGGDCPTDLDGLGSIRTADSEQIDRRYC